MNETDLILEALNDSAPIKRKRMIIPEIEIPMGYDNVIAGLAKRTRKRSPRKKFIDQWTNTDFLRYAKELLDVEGLVLESSSIRDRELMAKLYDLLAEHFQDHMTNLLLRSYLDWWVHSYARVLRRRSIHPQMFTMERYVETFIKTYEGTEKRAPAMEHTEDDPDEKISDHTLFELGGLPMLLMTEGIVIAYKVLLELKEDNIYNKLSVSLRGLTKDAVEKVIQITLAKKPYNREYAIDFISVAKPALEYYSIKKYSSIRHGECFET